MGKQGRAVKREGQASTDRTWTTLETWAIRASCCHAAEVAAGHLALIDDCRTTQKRA